jgi:hypothetical protein
VAVELGEVVLVPLDVEAAVVGFLRDLEYNASTRVPAQRVPGMIRVSRVGGEPIKDRVRDQPRILVEVWGANQGDSFDLAQRLFGVFEYAGKKQAIPDLGLAKCVPSPPVTFDDYDAPELHRHQFTVEMLTQMGRLTI